MDKIYFFATYYLEPGTRLLISLWDLPPENSGTSRSFGGTLVDAKSRVYDLMK